MILFILTLPIITFSLLDIAGQAFLISYLMAGMLIVVFLQHKKGASLFFPLEIKIFFLFLCYCFVYLGMLGAAGSLAQKNVTQLFSYIIFFVIYVVLINVIVHQSWQRIRLYVNCFVLISVIAALFSVFQAVAPAGSVFFNLLRNSNSAFSAMIPQASLGGHVGWGNLNRVTGFAPEPSMWAAYLCVVLALLTPTVIRQKIKISNAAYFVLLFISFVLTYGRTGWLSFAGMILISPYFFFKSRYKNIYLVFALIIMGITLTILPNLKMSVDYSQLERYLGMTNALRMFIANPIFGVGLGGFAVNWANYFPVLPLENTFDLKGSFAYNMFLKILAETGFLGITLWLGMLFVIWRKICFCIAKLNTSLSLYNLCLGLALAFLSIIFSWINIEGINFMYIWFIFALISAIYLKVGNKAQGEE